MKRYLFFIFLVLLLAGCRTSQVQDEIEPKPENIPEEVPQITREPEERDFAEMRPGVRNLDELTVAFTRQNIELDSRKAVYATEAQLFTGIYVGLFYYHPLTLAPVPALAERWVLSEDRMLWTFTIRRNARFSNGDPVRAEDFRSAWLSLLEPGRDAYYSSFFDIIEGARDFRNGIKTDPESVGITAADDRTLIVKLNSPASYFPALLCHHSFSPIHPSMIDKTDWSPAGTNNWQPPVSNGPFRIDTMNDESIVMQKNDQYWDRDRVALNKIIIKFADTPEDASHLWNSGEARWIAGNVNMEALTDLSGIQLNEMFATHYYFIRSEEKPWNDYRVRRAMTLVLPWEEIRNGYLLPTETLIYPFLGYPKIKGISESDIEEALRLMAEAGYENGEGLPELVIRLTPSRDAQRVGILMANAWKEILNFEVRVEVFPFDGYFESLREGGYTIASSTWIGDFADPYAFLHMFRRDSSLNESRLNDPDYEMLIERSMVEEGQERLATLAEAEKILLERGVVIPVCFIPALNIVDLGELDGWYLNVLDIHPFKYMNFRAFRPLPGVALVR